MVRPAQTPLSGRQGATPAGHQTAPETGVSAAHPASLPVLIHTGGMSTTTPTPVLVDAYAASAATGIKPGTIRVWLTRGKLTHHGYDTAGRTLVDLAEVQKLNGA
jgi:hypothetical protein